MKTTVIVNPKAGRGTGAALASALRSMLGDDRVAVRATAGPGHATILSRRAIAEGYDTVVAAGGDGTLNEVANGLIDSGAAMGVIPAGTANDVATHHGIPRAVAAASSIIRTRQIREVDMVRIDGRHYLAHWGIGFPCAVARAANQIKATQGLRSSIGRLAGTHLYLLLALRACMSHRNSTHKLRICHAGLPIECRALSLTIDNQPLLGGRLHVAPGCVDDDGLVDFCLVEGPRGPIEIASLLLRALRGTLAAAPGVRTWRAKSAVIRCDEPASVFGDGEVGRGSSEFRVDVVPRALRLIVPARAPELRRAA